MPNKKSGEVPRLADVKPLTFKPFSRKKLDEMTKNINESLRKQREEEERREAERWRPKKKQIGTCHCKGKIILVTTYDSEYDPMSGPLIIGPGSRGQFS
ncbi:MAG: hypothetical protein AAB392_01280, partial [Patescibacteria group bacterium]